MWSGKVQNNLQKTFMFQNCLPVMENLQQIVHKVARKLDVLVSAVHITIKKDLQWKEKIEFLQICLHFLVFESIPSSFPLKRISNEIKTFCVSIFSCIINWIVNTPYTLLMKKNYNKNFIKLQPEQSGCNLIVLWAMMLQPHWWNECLG